MISDKVENGNRLSDTHGNETGNDIEEINNGEKDKILKKYKDHGKEKGCYVATQKIKQEVKDTGKNNIERLHKPENLVFPEYDCKPQAGLGHDVKGDNHINIRNSGIFDMKTIINIEGESIRGDNRKNLYKHGDSSFSNRAKFESCIEMGDNGKHNLENTNHDEFDTDTRKKETTGDKNSLKVNYMVSRVVELRYTEHFKKEKYLDGVAEGNYYRSHSLERHYRGYNSTEYINSSENLAEQNKAHGERDSDISGPCIKNYTEQNKVHSERDDALSGLCIKNLAEENKAHSERDDAITGVCIKNLAEENKAHSERDDAITGLCIKNYTEQNKAHSERNDTISGLCIKVVRNVDNLFESGDDHEQNPITGNGLTRKNEVDLSNIPNLSRNVCGCRQTTMYQSCPCWHSGPRKKLSKPRDVPDQKVPVSNAHRNEENNRADLRHCDNKGVSWSEGNYCNEKGNICDKNSGIYALANTSGSKVKKTSDKFYARCCNGPDLNNMSVTVGNIRTPNYSSISQSQKCSDYVHRKFSSSERKVADNFQPICRYSTSGSRSCTDGNSYSDNLGFLNNCEGENQRSSPKKEQNASNTDDQKGVKMLDPSTNISCVTAYQQDGNNVSECKIEDRKMADDGHSDCKPSTIFKNKDENQTKVKIITVKLEQTSEFTNLFKRKNGRKNESDPFLNQKLTRANKATEDTKPEHEENLLHKPNVGKMKNETQITTTKILSFASRNPTSSNELKNTKLKHNETVLPTSVAEKITENTSLATTPRPTFENDKTDIDYGTKNEDHQTRATTQDQTHFKDVYTSLNDKRFNDNPISNLIEKKIVESGYNERIPHTGLNPNFTWLSKSFSDKSRKRMSRKTSPKATYAKDETNGCPGNSIENQNKEAYNETTEVKDLQPLISLIGGINHLTTLAKTLGLTVYDVQPDGNCMYRSVIDQLRIHGVFDLTAGLLRQQAVTYLTENPYHEDGSHLEAFLHTEKWDNYLARMRCDGEWGDQIMLRGIAEVTNRKICIISVIGSSHNQTTIQPGTGDADQSESIFLGHINDAHYVSLRPNDWLEKCFEKADKRAGFTEEHEYCRTTSGSHVQSSVPLPSIEVCVDHVTGWPFPHLTFMMAASFKEPYFYNRAKERRDIQEQFSIDTAVTFIEDREQITLVYPQNDYSGNRTLVYISPNIPNFVTFDQNNIGENTNYLAVELTTHPGRLSLQHVRRKESSDHPKSLLGHVKKSSVDEYDIQQFWQSVRLRRLPQTSANDLYCFATEEWPVCAMEWKEYRRLSGWPDSGLVKEIMEAGCLIIPLALTESTFPEMNWEICFANAEEKLLSTLTRSQRRCLHIFTELVGFCIGSPIEFQSRLLETVFFHACERIPISQWEETTVQCVLYLIDCLLLSLRIRSLSHYFVRDINLLCHLTEESLEILEKKISRLRRCIPIVFFFKSRVHNRDELFDPIIEDARHFTEHHHLQNLIHRESQKSMHTNLKEMIFRHQQNSVDGDPRRFMHQTMHSSPKRHLPWSAYIKLQKSVAKNILPSFITMVFEFVRLNAYKEATLLLKEAFSCGKLINVTEDMIILYLDIGKMEEFWLSFIMDYYFSTSMMKNFTEQYIKYTSIGELVQDENTEGVFNDILVPLNLISTETGLQGQSLDLDMARVFFLKTFCMTLIGVARLLGGNLLKECQPYLRSLILMIKRLISVHESQPINVSAMDNETNHDAGAQTNQKLKSWLKDSLEQLYFCYEECGMVELFYDFVKDLEVLYNEMQSVKLYQDLARIWLRLGQRQKYLDVMKKIEILDRT